jgi:hypothetical protein
MCEWALRVQDSFIDATKVKGILAKSLKTKKTI